MLTAVFSLTEIKQLPSNTPKQLLVMSYEQVMDIPIPCAPCICVPCILSNNRPESDTWGFLFIPIALVFPS